MVAGWALTHILQDNTIGDDGIGALMAALEQNGSLRSLDLRVCLLQPCLARGTDASVAGQCHGLGTGGRGGVRAICCVILVVEWGRRRRRYSNACEINR